jgi:NAD(P)-dependent dehydrogenase (short-subunit alcohol dehydrogenase family)
MRRVCLLTGASGRLGTALCQSLVDSHDILAVYRDKPPNVATEEQEFIDPLNLPEIASAGDRSPIFAVRAELGNDDDLDRIVELAAARFGQVDLLINAAAHRRLAGMIESDILVDEAALQFEINTLVPLRLAVRVARRFWKNRPIENRERNRNVVNISSTAGSVLYPTRGQSVYAASKAALEMLTRHMASEFAVFGIRANAVSPNSFPEIVPVEAVIDGVLEFDRGSWAGEVMVIDRVAGGRVSTHFDGMPVRYPQENSK